MTVAALRPKVRSAEGRSDEILDLRNSDRRCEAPQGGSINSLRVEHLGAPAIALARVDEAIVQTARALVPELDSLRNDPEAGPVRRSRHRNIREAGLELAKTLVERAGMLHRLALPRSPRAELALARTRGEICVRLLGAHLLRQPFHADLTLERLPVEAHRGLRMRDELLALATLVIRVERKAAHVHQLEQQDAHGGLSVLTDSGESERRRLGQALGAHLGRDREQLDETVERLAQRDAGGGVLTHRPRGRRREE